jgi:hypothetical protein
MNVALPELDWRIFSRRRAAQYYPIQKMSNSSNEQDAADKHESQERQRVDFDQRKKLDEKSGDDQKAGNAQVSIQSSN